MMAHWCLKILQVLGAASFLRKAWNDRALREAERQELEEARQMAELWRQEAQQWQEECERLLSQHTTVKQWS
jgi:hypothetical protein